MASTLLSRAPRCMSCVRRITGSFGEVFPLGVRQIRGKKKLAKSSTIQVHLLQNVPSYGRKGAVIPITPGTMRNIWYPKGMAEYLPAARRQEFNIKKDSLIERDSTFRTNKERNMDKKSQRLERNTTAAFQPEPIPIETQFDQTMPIDNDFTPPERLAAILEDLLPATLNFYRSPIINEEAAPKKVSPSIPASSVTSITASKDKELAARKKISIYGSVSTSDIAANLKAILAEDAEGARLNLSHEDISFVKGPVGQDRVKNLGVFEIEIKLNGASDSVRRTITVMAQD